MSYVRWSSKVVQDCPVCQNEGWVAILPEYPEALTWRGHMEGGERESLPKCCTSCWYIYESDRGLEIYHAGPHVCKAECEDVTLSREAATEWEPPDGCNFPDVARECVQEWLSVRAEP